SSSYNAATAASSATLPNQNHKLAPSSAGPVKSACLSAKAGAARRSGPGLGGGMTQQPVTPTNQEFEVTTIRIDSSQKRGQQPQPAASPDPLVAIRQLACQLAGKVAHRPDCVSLLSQLDSHIDQLAADIDTVASQLRDENRALRRRVRQLEGKLKTASSSGQSESMAASAASQSEAARREWGRREAQLLARLQAAEAARGSLESRTVALEKELKEMTRLSRPISVVSNGASNAPASASAAAATPPVPTPTSALLTAENLARHAALVANSPSSAFNYGEEDDYAISSVSQQQQRHQQPR
uniref:CCDC92 domain-containing protein n=1 Tax=Macrostomum lignano TaxID=282301 RepID=A0A1I8IQJ1_9PLAT